MASGLLIKRPSGDESIKLGKLLGKGATGEVYRIEGHGGEVAKIYLTPLDAADHHEKVRAMVAVGRPHLDDIQWNGKHHKQIAWPTALINDTKGEFRGIVMPEIDFVQSTSLENLIHPQGRRREKVSDFYGLRLTVAKNLASVFDEIHRSKHFMIDLKPLNLRFYIEHGFACIIDCDGFSISDGRKRYSARHYSDDYIAPEGKGRNPENLGVQQDLFALAAIIFQLLNNGIHPFQYRSSDDNLSSILLQDRIYRNLYAYGMVAHSDVEPIPHSIHHMFDASTRKMFDRAFLTSNRPTAADWKTHLAPFTEGKGVIRCKVNRDHLYFGNICVFCEVEARAKPPPPPPPSAARTTGTNTPPPRARTQTQTPVQPTATSSISPETAWKWIGGVIVALFLISLINSGGNVSNPPSQNVDAASGAADATAVAGAASMGASPPELSVDAETNAAFWYLVRDTYVRQQPTANSAKVNVLPLSRAEAVQGIMIPGNDPQYQWLQITSGPNAGYFVAGSNLSSTARQDLDTSFNGSKRIYSSGSIYREADRNSSVLQTADAGMRLNVVGAIADGLVEISLQSGVVGYVDRSIFSVASVADSGPQPMQSQSSMNVNEPVQRRQRLPQSRQANVVTCILPDGGEARISADDCRNQSGVIY